MKVGGLTRRDLLRLLGAGSTLSLVRGCGDNFAPRKPDRLHAAAVFEPESDSFLVSAWSAIARSFAVDVSTDGSSVFQTVAEVSDVGQVAVDVRGLAPATTYQLTLLGDDGVLLGPHRVRTAPRVDDPRPVRIAVSADIDPYREFRSDIVSHLVATEPELFVSLGDFPYTDNGPPAMTLDVYRERHVQARVEPRFRALLEACGMRAIYDDHEFRNDWDASYVISEADRYVAAMQAYDEFFPLRADGTRPQTRYRSWRWGAHLECFLLDTRRHRSANNALDDANKTMLGAPQLAWLVDGVQRSTATFKVIFTSVPLDFGEGPDHWVAFTTERNAMFRALVGIPGVVFISADQHVFAAHRHVGGIREFQVGPLARGLGAPQRLDSGVLFRSLQLNFGVLDVDGDGLTMSGIGADGTVFYKETLSASDLTPSGPQL